ncbi:MAG: hypothetical protein R3D00_06950 [Bacteroidia bacterium]
MKVIFLFFPFLFLTACEREAPQPPDPLDLLPPATQTGENTLGFLLDGEPWLPNRIFQGDYRKSDGRFNIQTRNEKYDENGNPIGSTFSIGSINTSLLNEGDYQITEYGNLSAGIYFLVGCYYVSFSDEPGLLDITRLDTFVRIISGTFHCKVISEDCTDTLNITHGRFDVSF